jgi:hypothetical protein
VRGNKRSEVGEGNRDIMVKDCECPEKAYSVTWALCTN